MKKEKTIHTKTALPEGYGEILSIDLQKDKKTAVTVNLLCLAVMLVMIAAMHFYIPVTTLFDLSKGWGIYWLRLGALVAGYAVYMIFHELTHAAVMKGFGGGKVKFGFTGLYAYAGSETDYFDRRAYTWVALAPLLVWGILLLIGSVLVPKSWFWAVYGVQVGNVAGSMGDVYVTARLARLPKNILVRDTGTAMTAYAKET